MGSAEPYLVNLKSNTMKNTLQRYAFFLNNQNFLKRNNCNLLPFFKKFASINEC